MSHPPDARGATRRQALLALVAAALSPLPWLGRAHAAVAAAQAETLDAVLDVLLPADDLTPAASALGVGADILALAADQPLLAELITRVCAWLDTTGAGRFVDLTATDKETVVAYLAQADVDTLEGRFYQLVRLLAIEFYYARPEALAGLDLNPTPQPAGYPPPWG